MNYAFIHLFQQCLHFGNLVFVWFLSRDDFLFPGEGNQVAVVANAGLLQIGECRHGEEGIQSAALPERVLATAVAANDASNVPVFQ